MHLQITQTEEVAAQAQVVEAAQSPGARERVVAALLEALAHDAHRREQKGLRVVLLRDGLEQDALEDPGQVHGPVDGAEDEVAAVVDQEVVAEVERDVDLEVVVDNLAEDDDAQDPVAVRVEPEPLPRLRDV